MLVSADFLVTEGVHSSTLPEFLDHRWPLQDQASGSTHPHTIQVHNILDCVSGINPVINQFYAALRWHFSFFFDEF